MIDWCRRDKTLNYFNIMLRKRLKNDDEGMGELEEGESSKKKLSKTDKSLVCNMSLSVFIGKQLAAFIIPNRF